MNNNYCFTVTQYTYTDEDVTGKDIIRKEHLSLPQALMELATYCTEHPDCYATTDGFLSEYDDESIYGVSGFNEQWSAQISCQDPFE